MPPEVNDSTQPLDNAINANTGSPDQGVPSGDSTPIMSPTPTPDSSDPVEGQGTATPSVESDGTKKTPWFQRRIDQLTAEKWEERRTADNLRKQTSDLLTQLAEARKAGQVAPIAISSPAPSTPSVNIPPTMPSVPMTQNLSEAEINAMAEKRAEEISRQRSFNKACNDIADAGKGEFGDFDQKLRTFAMLGGMPTPLMETITEMPNAHKILYNLGSDPDLAERVLKMAPVKQALELARLENSLGKSPARQVSSAPPPVQPIDTGSRATDDPEKMSMEDFVKWREKNATGRRK